LAKQLERGRIPPIRDLVFPGELDEFVTHAGQTFGENAAGWIRTVDYFA